MTNGVNSYSNIIVIPNSNDFEKQLIDEGYLPEVEKALNETHGTNNFLDDYITKNQGQKGKGGVLRDYSIAGGREIAAIDALRGNKTKMAIPIATEISEMTDTLRRFPSKVLELFQKISQDLGLPKMEEPS